MNTSARLHHRKRNDTRGFVSMDFIFAIMVAFGIVVVLFAMTLTLSMVEIGQYIAFSVSRAFIAAQADEPTQEAAAQAKFAALQAQPQLKFLFANEWFSLGNLEIRSGINGNDFSDRYPQTPGRLPDTGIRLTFESKVLSIRIANLGSTDDEGKGFKSLLTGMLIREPTQSECWSQIKNDRYKAIMSLDPRFSKIAGSASQNSYHPLEDNGC